MVNFIYVALAFFSLVLWYLYIRIHRWRFQKYAHWPKQFPQSLIFGHLKVIGKGMAQLGDMRHHFGEY